MTNGMKDTAKAVAAVVVLLAAAIYLARPAADRDADRNVVYKSLPLDPPLTGERGYIVATTLAGSDSAAYGQAHAALAANDMVGLKAIAVAGRAMFLDKGTQVLMLDVGVFSHTVRVESGPATGKSVVIPSDMASKRKP